MILKFSVGRPSMHVIQEHIANSWHLVGSFVVGLLDLSHVIVHLDSHEDMVRALSNESHMINNCMYRSFRWSPDFAFRRDSPRVAVWARLHHLPLPFFTPSFLYCIGYSFGHYLRADDRTLALTHPMYARICVEIDVSLILPARIWIGTSKEEGFWQPIEFEGNISFCEGCGLLGHLEEDCRKKRRGRSGVVAKSSDIGKGMTVDPRLRIDPVSKTTMPPVIKQHWQAVAPKKHNLHGSGSNSKDGQGIHKGPEVIDVGNVRNHNEGRVSETLNTGRGRGIESRVTSTMPLNGDSLQPLGGTSIPVVEPVMTTPVVVVTDEHLDASVVIEHACADENKWVTSDVTLAGSGDNGIAIANNNDELFLAVGSNSFEVLAGLEEDWAGFLDRGKISSVEPMKQTKPCQLARSASVDKINELQISSDSMEAIKLKWLKQSKEKMTCSPRTFRASSIAQTHQN